MPFSTPHRIALLVLVAAAQGLALASARADPPAQQADGTAKDRLDFRICRIPGMDAATSDQTIEIPAGTEYDQGHPSLDNPVALQSAKPQLPLIVVTTQAQTLPANGFCVTVPVKPRGNVTEAAIRASIGATFEPNGNWHDPAGIDPVSLTYGYWESTRD